MTDNLVTLSSEQRRASNRATLAATWTEMVARLSMVHVGRDPSVRYDTRMDQSVTLRDRINAVRSLADEIAPVFEHIGAEAADFGGVRDEGFDPIRAAIEDWLGTVEKAADNLEEEAAELMAERRYR